MAHVEKVAELNGEESRIMNVSEGVGPNWGMPDDVMLVKALLETPLLYWGADPGTLSSPTSGTLDENTKKNVKVFQKKFNQSAKSLGNPERLTEDGRVSRARGQVSWDKNRPWTIVKLNAVTSWYLRMKGGKSAAEMIVVLYPHLADILKLDPSDV